MSDIFTLRKIGMVRSNFTQASGTPIQPLYASGSEGRVIVEEPFVPALDDIDGFDRLWLIYWMDRAAAFKPHVLPYRDTKTHGLFTTRAPCRPNPIGLSAVCLRRREGPILYCTEVDILDGTPLLDIKPYVTAFDAHPSAKSGWFDHAESDRQLADERFHDHTAYSKDNSILLLCHGEVFQDGKIVLRLRNVCIETAAKHFHRELVNFCIEAQDPVPDLENPIELVRVFLQTADFGKIRRTHSELAGGCDNRVLLQFEKDGTVRWGGC